MGEIVNPVLGNRESESRVGFDLQGMGLISYQQDSRPLGEVEGIGKTIDFKYFVNNNAKLPLWTKDVYEDSNGKPVYALQRLSASDNSTLLTVDNRVVDIWQFDRDYTVHDVYYFIRDFDAREYTVIQKTDPVMGQYDHRLWLGENLRKERFANENVNAFIRYAVYHDCVYTIDQDSLLQMNVAPVVMDDQEVRRQIARIRVTPQDNEAEEAFIETLSAVYNNYCSDRDILRNLARAIGDGKVPEGAWNEEVRRVFPVMERQLSKIDQAMECMRYDRFTDKIFEDVIPSAKMTAAYGSEYGLKNSGFVSKYRYTNKQQQNVFVLERVQYEEQEWFGNDVKHKSFHERERTCDVWQFHQDFSPFYIQHFMRQWDREQGRRKVHIIDNNLGQSHNSSARHGRK